MLQQVACAGPRILYYRLLTFLILVATSDLMDLFRCLAFSATRCRLREFCFASTAKTAAGMTTLRGRAAGKPKNETGLVRGVVWHEVAMGWDHSNSNWVSRRSLTHERRSTHRRSEGQLRPLRPAGQLHAAKGVAKGALHFDSEVCT
jgi:hypothetical protein